ncbi:hypothetical protein HZA57_02125 [Candidatus Poribacteria bacterium]|nr:hypothetical protein [Candidatus Poribacteria bacterium]
MGALAPLLVLAAAPLVTPKEISPDSTRAQAPNATDSSAGFIRGSMTLGDLERSTGIGHEELCGALGIPENTEPGERLGRLRQRHGFSMEEVRKLADAARAGHSGN